MSSYRFRDFLTFNQAATCTTSDKSTHDNIVECFVLLSQLARKHPRIFREAVKKRKGVTTVRRPLSDPEHEILAKGISKKGIPSALAGIFGGQWEIIKLFLELAGLTNPDSLIGMNGKAQLEKIRDLDWSRATPEAVKALAQKTGRTQLLMPDPEYQRQFGIERLKRIRRSVQAGRELTDPKDREIHSQWQQLVSKLQGDPATKIIGAGGPSVSKLERPPEEPSPEEIKAITKASKENPASRIHTDPGRFKPADIRRSLKWNPGDEYGKFLSHRITLGSFIREAEGSEIGLNLDDTYDKLTQSGVEVISDDESIDALLRYISRHLIDGTAFVPRGKSDQRMWQIQQHRIKGKGLKPSMGKHDPERDPGFAQAVTGMTTPLVKTATTKSFGEPQPLTKSRDTGDVPPFYVNVDKIALGQPDEEINKMYDENPDIFEKEVFDIARRIAKQIVSSDVDAEDVAQDIAMRMREKTAIPGWREDEGLRKNTALQLARQLGVKLQRTRKKATAFGKQQSGAEGGSDWGAEHGKVKKGAGSKTQATTGIGGEKVTDVKAKDVKQVKKSLDTALDIDTSDMPDSDAEWIGDLKSQLTKALKDNDREAAREAISDLLSLADEYPQLKEPLNNVISMAAEL